MIPASITLADLQNRSKKNMVGHLGIEFTAVSPEALSARMPVDERTRQPMGLLHGGASVVLAETLGSVAANLCVDPTQHYCVGQEVNANHVRSARSGYVHGTARPVHLGRRTHVWEIRIVDEQNKLVCVSRLTLAVLDYPERR